MQAERWFTAARAQALVLTVVLSAATTAALAQDGPTDLSVTYSPHAAHTSCNMNMGPTGATAWMRGYHFVVTSIQQQSPGYGKLMLGDVVVGAAGELFGPDHNPRMTLGNAIGQAEATGESLKLTVLRRGEQRVVAIDLPKLGAYASTWPANCAKSRRILDDACQALLGVQMPNGNVPTDGSFGLFTTGLLFLGTDDARYLDPARRAVYFATTLDYSPVSYNNWSMGYGGVLMAEYYLKTGDATVLPKLEEIADRLAKGQMICGSWGHKSPSGGYGALNQAGLLCAMALVLAKECGVEVDQAAHDKALHFFGRYAGTGAVPYGDHRPGRSMDDNGKSSMAAVLFHLAGDERKMRAFADTVADSYWLREQGHTGGYFSIVWGPLGAALAGESKLRPFLDYQRWYYELGRKWTGDLTILPYKEALTRFDDSSYIESGGRFSTGGLALVYAMPTHKLRIFGAPPSVFGTRAKLAGDLKRARDLYLVRQWGECDALLAQIDPAKLANDDERYWLEQMRSARELTRRATDRVLAEIDCNLREGGAFWADQQFRALKRCVGDTADPRFAALEERFADGTIQWYVREGQRFHERWEQINAGMVLSWTPQGQQLMRMMEGVPSSRLPFWEPLSPSAQLAKPTWRTKLYDPGDEPAAGWFKPGFDDSDWRQGEGIVTRHTADGGGPDGPIAARRVFTVDNVQGKALRVRLQTVRAVRVPGGQRDARTKVYLNGTLIVDAERGRRGGYASIPLDDRALGLLKEGENVLAVTSTVQGRGGNHLDVALDINRSGYLPRYLPVERLACPPTASLPDTDTTLRVDEATGQFAEALKQSYDAKPIDELVRSMASVNHWYRMLAEDALVAKGIDGIRPAIARHDDPSWIVRASALIVMRKAMKNLEAEDDKAIRSLLESQVPAVLERLKDDRLWVRMAACQTLEAFGKQAEVAVPALIEASNDPEQWVRECAMSALQTIGADRDALMVATREALDRHNSAYGIARQAVRLVKTHGAADPDNLDILVNILRNAPEGGGGGLLVEIIDMACQLDPAGEVMVPVLTDIASNRTDLSRQRGNPRGKAIEALGAYGPKAASAVRVLRAIADPDAEDSHREAAAKALQAITGQPVADANAPA